MTDPGELVTVDPAVIRRALYKARREYVRVADAHGHDPGPDWECWAEFERLADAAGLRGE